MDILTKELRSWNMSRIRAKNTKPEILVRRFLYSNGVRYRIHAKLPGKPDIVIKRKMLAIFVNGCFWHGHTDCKDFALPKTRTDFWRDKIAKNVARDEKNQTGLIHEGWRVLTVWECELGRDKESTLRHILRRTV